MLVLTRREGESLIIAGIITVKVVRINGRQVQLGIDAPKEITVLRDDAITRSEKRESQR